MHPTVTALNAQLRRLGISNREAADFIPLHYNTIQRTLSGKIPPTTHVEEVFRETAEKLRTTSIRPQKQAVYEKLHELHKNGIPRFRIAVMAGIPQGAVAQMMRCEKVADKLWLTAYKNLNREGESKA
ncbi:MAG: hypothetical protein ABT01_08595 [Clostridium sp. SCN 57-10]|mgnify:CR=1 FL=1|nr:MAG: hypothetical protein ABT01_08595 [Clostridium sp. SCN 57-10]